jgi:hypothetical protein
MHEAKEMPRFNDLNEGKGIADAATTEDFSGI